LARRLHAGEFTDATRMPPPEVPGGVVCDSPLPAASPPPHTMRNTSLSNQYNWIKRFIHAHYWLLFWWTDQFKGKVFQPHGVGLARVLSSWGSPLAVGTRVGRVVRGRTGARRPSTKGITRDGAPVAGARQCDHLPRCAFGFTEGTHTEKAARVTTKQQQAKAHNRIIQRETALWGRPHGLPTTKRRARIVTFRWPGPP